MRRAIIASLAPLTLISCLWAVPTTSAEGPITRLVETSSAELQEVAELKRLETRINNAIQKTLPALVAVDFPAMGKSNGPRLSHIALTNGSGVIISPEGLILSQWHVTHKGTKGALRNAGDEIEVVLQDGRRLKAELLGADPVRDVSLLQITKADNYPHVLLAKPKTVKQGDRVLKLGHPFGYRASRGATARLGRVLYTGEALEIVADALTFAGDSGGPLINMDGELIGLLESSAAPQYVIWNMPERSGNPTCYMGVETIERLMPALRSPDQALRFDATFKVKDLPDFQKRASLTHKEIYGDTDSRVLPVEAWTQGDKLRAPWNDLTQQYQGSVVEVLGNDRRVAYGTIVGAEGWILTKASEIPNDPQVRLPDGKVFTGRVAGADPEYDLALLKIDALGLRAVEWSEDRVSPAGKFVAAPDGRGGSIGVGIVSVAQRDLEGPFPKTITKTKPYAPKPTPPEVLGRVIEGKGLLVRRAKGSASKAGIVSGDVLLSVNGQPIRDHDDVDRCVDKSSPGDILPIILERDGERVSVSLRLTEEPYVRCPGAIARYRNLRADDFPTVFEHDIPLTLDECGGPVINLEGKAIGITIARVAQHGCMAIPADAIGPLMARLKQ